MQTYEKEILCFCEIFIFIFFTWHLWTRWCFSCFEFSFQGSFKYVSVWQYGKHLPLVTAQSVRVFTPSLVTMSDHRITMRWYLFRFYREVIYLGFWEQHLSKNGKVKPTVIWISEIRYISLSLFNWIIYQVGHDQQVG